MQAVKEQLRAPPHNGIGFGVLRYLSKGRSDAPMFASDAEPDILFNYLGQWNTRSSETDIVRFAHPVGMCRKPETDFEHAIEIDAVFFDGRLHVDIDFDPVRVTVANVQEILTTLVNTLETFEHATPGNVVQEDRNVDISQARLSQAEFDDILTEFAQDEDDL